ncbi:MAG: PKD domain-containing protein [Bacteroidetes bacterium]|nr:PKD domain-containing protein [Bacteroidota bacterium]
MHKHFLSIILLLLSLLCANIKSNAQTFPNPATLSTGQGTQGTNDPIWQVSDWFFALPQNPLTLGYVPAYISNNCAPGAWIDPASLPPPVNNGNWISGSDMICDGIAGYRYFRLILNLPADCGGNSVTIPGSYTLNLDGYVDNTLMDVMINGVSENLAVLPGGAFMAGTQVNLVLDGPWVPGINYVDFLVYNGGGPYGLLMVANSTVNMSNDSDGDGIVDMNDLCPCEAGTNPYGCIDPINPGNCNSNQIRTAFTNAGCIELYNCINSCSMYFLNPQSLSGTGAQTFAQSLGANLISIQDAVENQCIIDNLNSLGESGVIWIGFNDELVEGSFVWYDQSPITYTNWAAGEPNNSGNEDYVQIYVNGQWNDLAFGGSAKSIIEVNLCPVIDAGVNQVICQGTSATLTASNTLFGSSPYSYQWTNGAPTQSTSVAPASTTTYGILSTDAYGCTAADTVVVTVYDNPTVVVPIDTIVCDAATITATNYISPTTGTTFDWTNDNVNIGLAASGTGDIASFSATNITTAPITANITVTPTANGCVGTSSTYSITVHPTPTVVVPIDTIVCDAATITATNYTSPTTGTTFDWTNDNVNIGLAVSGTGDIASFSATNITTAPITANITVTPTANGCVGTPSTYIITVHPLPTPNFTFLNICFGSLSSFTDLSNANGGALANWNWDFTNNGSVDNTTQSPNNGYPAVGSYTVELMVQTALGCKDSITKTVTVNPIPVANFSATSECLNTTTQFTDSSTVITGTISSFQWDFADGSGTDTLQSPTYLYTAANTYNVSLTVISDSGCINTIVKPVTVFNNPIAAFTTTDVCQNITANFDSSPSNGNGGTIDQWNWDIDFDGITHTTDYTSQNPTNNYATANNYTVELIVTTTDGCSDTITNPITIFPMPIASYSYTDTCYGIANSFTDNSTVSSGTITNWDWDFGDTQTSNIEDPTHDYLIEGIYSVELIVTTNNSCSDTIVKNNIEVWPLPDVNFTTIPVCLNNITQFTDTSTVSNLYTVNTNETWAWDFGDGVGVSNIQYPNYMYASDGVFMTTLTVTTDRNCSNFITKPVTVYPLPEADFVADNPSDCSPVEGILTNLTTISGISTITQWDWDFNGDGITDNNGENPFYSFSNPSRTSIKDFTIRLIATSNFGCKDTLTKNNYIYSHPNPLASFSYWPNEVTIVDKELTFSDQSIIATTWEWDLGDGTTSDLQHPIHEYADTGYFLVALTIENQYGCRDSTQKYIQIKPIYAVWIPNAFTPNNDFINDYFSVDGYGILQLQMSIYNKWGELLYESDELAPKWDGTYKGDVVEEGVYVYKLRVYDILFEWHDYIGKLNVVR